MIKTVTYTNFNGDTATYKYTTDKSESISQFNGDKLHVGDIVVIPVVYDEDQFEDADKVGKILGIVKMSEEELAQLPYSCRLYDKRHSLVYFQPIITWEPPTGLRYKADSTEPKIVSSKFMCRRENETVESILLEIDKASQTMLEAIDINTEVKEHVKRLLG